jgi:2,5-dioxopentanoate dehydrogenase
MPDATSLTGNHLIAGEWVEGGPTFQSSPVSGEGMTFRSGGAQEIERAATAAAEAFRTYGRTSREDRAAFLEAIAGEIEARAPDIIRIGHSETGLPEARMKTECARTTGQLRLFAGHIRKGDYLDRRHDEALPDRAPLARPELFMVQHPIGPVGVFGASNFPLAFSTAGGDTAAALAAGCPVIYKGHPGHPATGELVAHAIAAAIGSCGMPPGTFALVQSNTNEAGEALVRHPVIRAVGFTGSYRGGKALFDIACARPEPIPFFGELGSINPVFVMPAALADRGPEIARDWAASLTMGVGQFCTNPGIVVLPGGPEADAFVDAAAKALGGRDAEPMLTEGTARGYQSGVARLAGTPGVKQIVAPQETAPRCAAPALFEVTGAEWLANPDLAEEVFGPAAIIIRARDVAEAREIAEAMDGQLTATLQLDPSDIPQARDLMPALEHRVGRILANGYPTGVEVAEAMVHGGPFPASTNFGATSVGTLAIRRFLRPVCYQNLPQELLPEDLRA